MTIHSSDTEQHRLAVIDTFALHKAVDGIVCEGIMPSPMEPTVPSITQAAVIDRQQAGKMERRKTALTVSTASTTSSSESSTGTSSIHVQKLGRESSSESLLRLLVHKVAEEMIDEYKDKAMEVDLDAIIEAVRSTLDKNVQMASLSGCDADSFAPSDEVFDCIDVSESPSTFSDLSNKTGSAPKVDEIYSPDFWGGSDLNDDYLETCTKTTDGSYRSSDQGTFASVSSLQDFIQRHNESSSSESEESSITDEEQNDDDDLSTISDISGLTECFDEFPERRRAKHKPPLPLPSTSHLSTTKSLVGSIVGSTVSKTSSKSSRKGIQRRVSFDTVHIRHYERIMSDNPASTQGPSVGIGWKYVQRRPKSVDDHQNSCSRRGPSQLVLSRQTRERMIRKLGYTEREIAACVRELNKARFQRRQTVNNLSASKVEESVEAAKRMVKQILFLKKNERIDKVHANFVEI